MEVRAIPAIPYNDTPVRDGAWDGPGNEAKIPNDASASVLRKMYTWVDPNADPATKAAYKLPHHFVGADGTPGDASVAGVRAAMSRLGQSATQIPSGDVAAVRSHLQKHLDRFNSSQGGDSGGNGQAIDPAIFQAIDRATVPVTVNVAIIEGFLPLARIVAAEAAIIPAAALAPTSSIERVPTSNGSNIAVIPLSGVITPRGSLIAQLFGLGSGGLEGFRAGLREAMADETVEAIVLDINSPGGLVDMVPETAQEVYDARSVKPVTAVANTMAASAAYWLGSQGGELVATPSAQVGSIGVYTIHEDISEMQRMMGIKTTVISAGRYKGEALEPLSKGAQQAMQRNVDDLYQMFTQQVATARHVPVEAVQAGYGEGRVVLGDRARQLAMVDRVETLEQTLTRLGATGEQPEVTEPDAGLIDLAAVAEPQITEPEADPVDLAAQTPSHQDRPPVLSPPVPARKQGQGALYGRNRRQQSALRP